MTCHKTGVLTYDVRMSLFNWLVFLGRMRFAGLTTQNSTRKLRSLYNNRNYSHILLKLLLISAFSLIWVRRENKFAFLILLLGLLSFIRLLSLM